MVYQQNKTWKKFLEIGIAFAALIAADQIFNLQLIQHELHVFFLVTVLFALRYGIAAGTVSYALSVTYQVYTAATRNEDIFQYFYAPEEVWKLAFFAVIVAAAGLFSTSFREQYVSIQYKNEEIQDENDYLNDTVGILESSQKTLRQKILESEYSLSKIYEVGLALDQPHTELIRSEAVRVFSSLFQTGEVALYHVDKSRKSLRLLIRRHTGEEFQQTIWLDHAPSSYKRFFQQPGLTIRTVEDDEGSPLLIAPIFVYGHLNEIVVIRNLPFEKLTSYDLQIFTTILNWISTRYEKARLLQQKANKENFLPGTTIHTKKAFDELLAIQEERVKDLNQPYVILTFPVSDLRGLSLIEFELIIHSIVREVDLVGYDEEKEEILLMLPNTSPVNESIIYNRIDGILKTKGRVS